MDQKYIPLHVHTATGSVGDSILGIPEYVKKAKEYGVNALAITDHGSMGAIYSFATECQEAGINPVIGMEAYVVNDSSKKDKDHGRTASHHLVLLARTTEGIKNLLSIHNHAATEGFYYEPRTDWEHIQKYGNGIIGLSACVGGEIPQAILAGDLDYAKDLIGFYKESLDEFYLELQPGNFDAQLQVNRALVKLSEEMDVPLVVTNDIHYLDADDAVRHDYHVKLGRKSKADDGFVYPDTCYWFMDANAIKKHFVYDDIVTENVVAKAIDMTAKIADNCTAKLDTELHMPVFPTNNEETEEEMLYRMCYSRLMGMIENKPNPQEYVDRLDYELTVIREKGFCGYFLIVQDYVNWARENGIAVGPGRGSAAGSLVAHLLGITQPDPVKYGLLFERFLDPHRKKIPDIDVDFSVDGRDRMFQYAVEKYGYDRCALVSTLGTRKAKAAIHDAARILGYEPSVGNEIAKLIPDVYYGDDGEKKKDLDIKSSIEVVPELKKMSEKYHDILKLATDLEGLPSSKGIHAAGIIISPESLLSKAPLIKSNKDRVLATALNLGDAEKFLVKFDFLALATLDVINAVEKEVGWKFDYDDESLLHDDAVWNIISSRNTTGIFQIASKTYKDRMPRLKPRSIEELAACLALVRGPAISAHTDETYMRIVEGKEDIQKIHPLYDEVTSDTKGILVYQEQVMHLAVAFGMDLSTGYQLVKLGQKKKMKELGEYRAEFVTLASKKDCDEETANKIFDMVVRSAEYSFNYSHAVSYAFITYASAYLKVHYPLEFARALLTNTYARNKDKEYDMVLEDCRRQGIQFLPADFVKSNWEFSVENGKIRIGLCAVKGFGEKAVEAITNIRGSLENTKTIGELYSAIEDSEEARALNKKVMTVAVFSGLLDSFRKEGESRADLCAQYFAARGKKEEVPDEVKLSAKETFSTEADDAALEEIFYCGQFIYDPSNELSSFGWNNIKNKASFEADGYIRKVKIIKTKAKENMAFLTMATGDGDIEATVFPNVMRKVGQILRSKSMIRFHATKDNQDACILRSASAM